MSKDINIAITGASGFLGTHLLKKITEKDTNITLLDREPNRPQISELIKQHKVDAIRYDVVDPVLNIKDKIKEIDCLVHLSAFVPRSADPQDDDLEKSIEVNVKGTCNLVKIFESVKQIIFASTLDVYGIPTALPIDEKHPTNPLSYYGISKLSAEKYLLAFSRHHGTKIAILRFSNVYGPGELYKRAIPCFIRTVIRNKSPVIYGDGTDIRDYVYVEDTADAIISTIQKNADGIYNIASGKGYSIREIAEKTIKISGKSLRPVFKSTKRIPVNFVFDITKAQKELSYYPQTDIMNGLFNEYEWYKNLKND